MERETSRKWHLLFRGSGRPASLSQLKLFRTLAWLTADMRIDLAFRTSEAFCMYSTADNMQIQCNDQ